MRWVRRSVWDVVPRDQQDTPEGLRRRQVVVVATVVVGAVLLGISLRLEPGSVSFYVATLALAGVWAAGAFVSGRLHAGRIASRPAPDITVRPIVEPILLGLALALLFVVGGLVVREIPWLFDQVRSVTDFADQGAIWLVVIVTAVNGIAEELFWRGAAYAAIPRNPVAWTTIAYVLATLGTGNVMLAFAAILLGAIVGLQRRASGGVLAPILTHCTWSISMLFVLPVLFA
ncbi:CPBP family intramembrane glutamic endopeptidase [Aeromicrobium sp. Leaf350]|uniref:CPBP family intramembrane glutamic endopeptidase n=1 Tax=Aeromicrobium sp. Leaf350 TaxID=2876565 RepID=UPI001E3E4C66|nr:CPBP family intramembrane glutamic endopeptidase [Aeromicrobium sp. Leaf350]